MPTDNCDNSDDVFSHHVELTLLEIEMRRELKMRKVLEDKGSSDHEEIKLSRARSSAIIRAANCATLAIADNKSPLEIIRYADGMITEPEDVIWITRDKELRNGT